MTATKIQDEKMKAYFATGIPQELFCKAMGLSGSHEIDYDGKEWTAFTAGIESAPAVIAVPKGWKIVPDEDHMTDEQAEALVAQYSCCGGGAYEGYVALLKASPEYPGELKSTPGASRGVAAAGPKIGTVWRSNVMGQSFIVDGGLHVKGPFTGFLAHHAFTNKLALVALRTVDENYQFDYVLLETPAEPVSETAVG